MQPKRRWRAFPMRPRTAMSRTRFLKCPITWRAVPQAVVILIQDNGIGLTNPSNLFVPFYTTKPGGSGIGLALARQICEAHGGVLQVANRHDGPGCGAEIRLPLRQSQDSLTLKPEHEAVGEPSRQLFFWNWRSTPLE